MNILFVALSTSRQQQTARDIRFLLDHGGRATVLTTKLASWPELPPGVRIEELGTEESRHWFVRGERIAVFRLPDLVLRVIRKIVVLLLRVIPAPGGERALDWIGRVRVRQQRAAKRFHKERFGPFYRNIRPFVLWRTARARVLPSLGIENFDAVVIADALSTPIGWNLAHRSQDLPVWFSLDRDRVVEAEAGNAVPGT